MVGRHLMLSMLLVVLSYSAVAQSYSHLDTVSVYPNYGTFYHDRFVGRKTASGEVFDQNKFTAAHWRIKLGTYILVTNQNTGLQVIVKVNDRCPKHGVIDMTHRAAAAIGIKGCQKVTIRVLPPGYEALCEAQDATFDSVEVRSVKPAPRPAPAPMPAPKPQSIVPTSTVSSVGSYNIQLATAGSHGEAFTLGSKLPAEYASLLTVDSLEGSNALRLTLELHQSRADADRVRRRLKSLFPQARVVASD